LSQISTTRVKSLHTLTTILDKIQQAQTEIDILSAFKTGTSVLKEVVGRLDVGEIEETMDGLVDVLADQREIEEALGMGVGVADEEVEEELEKMLQEEQSERDERNEHVIATVEGLKVIDKALETEMVGDAGKERTAKKEKGKVAVMS
jgi:charged multivesicular body protein 7